MYVTLAFFILAALIIGERVFLPYLYEEAILRNEDELKNRQSYSSMIYAMGNIR